MQDFRPGWNYPSFVPQHGSLEVNDFMTSPMAQQVAGSMFQPMLSKTQQASELWFSSLKSYFNVDNVYVWRKLKMILFPFFHQTYKRNSQQQYDRDLNAPDLYIPVMSFVTYVLLIALSLGANEKFKPDVIGLTMTTALLSVFLEQLLLKTAIWLQNLTNITFLDLLSFTGYKFVVAVMNLSSGILFGSIAFLFSYIVNTLFFSIFLFRTLKATQLGNDGILTRNYFLISAVLLQFLIIYFLCHYTYDNPVFDLGSFLSRLWEGNIGPVVPKADVPTTNIPEKVPV
eukprot:TRINITY_DN14369_c0_g2_i3.p1 TRINITY_DN14369_c0_g2~~TRINITY_DN14369_c0_g2_i3.p1  ORF type:complete len:286 (+),score=27.78 TRINITY_DN14369_c0_g2_i3:61-918(+)